MDAEQQRDFDFAEANRIWGEHHKGLTQKPGVIAVAVCCNLEKTQFGLMIYVEESHHPLPAEIEGITVVLQKLAPSEVAHCPSHYLEGHITFIQSLAILERDPHAIRWVAPHLEVCDDCRRGHEAYAAAQALRHST